MVFYEQDIGYFIFLCFFIWVLEESVLLSWHHDCGMNLRHLSLNFRNYRIYCKFTYLGFMLMFSNTNHQ